MREGNGASAGLLPTRKFCTMESGWRRATGREGGWTGTHATALILSFFAITRRLPQPGALCQWPGLHEAEYLLAEPPCLAACGFALRCATFRAKHS